MRAILVFMILSAGAAHGSDMCPTFPDGDYLCKDSVSGQTTRMRLKRVEFDGQPAIRAEIQGQASTTPMVCANGTFKENICDDAQRRGSPELKTECARDLGSNYLETAGSASSNQSRIAGSATVTIKPLRGGQGLPVMRLNVELLKTGSNSLRLSVDAVSEDGALKVRAECTNPGAI